MAKVTSGSFNTTAYSGRYLVFSWTATQSIADNTSSISWTLTGAGGGSGYYMAGNFKVIIAGETVYSSSNRIQLYNGTTVASGTKVIKHNTNGAKSFSASAEAGIYTVAVNCSGGGSWDLKDIPRAASITAAPNFNDEQSPTITFSNPAGSAATVSACISLDGSAQDIAYRTVTGSSYTFNLTAAERNLLRNATLNGTTRTVRFYLRTLIGGNYFYTYVTKTLTIVNAAPVLAPSIVDTGTISKTLTGDTNKIIKGYNNITAKVNPTAQKGSTIKEYKVSCGGKEIKNTAAASFTNVESGSFIVTATDGRGLTTTQTINKTLIAHFKPTCNMVKNNVSTDGKYIVSVSGKFFNGSFGAVNNALVVQFRFRESNGTYSAWQALSPTISGNDYTAAATITGLNYQNSYDIQARAFDTIGANDTSYIAETEELTVSAIPVFAWGKDCFEHYTHIQLNNSKAIYGTDTSGNRWAALEPCTINNITSLGWGSYANSLGRTEIWGNNVNINFRGALNIGGRAYGTYKVLCTTRWFMMAEQTINLSEAISAQPNGIVLVFSLYRDGAASDVSLHSFFISKYDIATFNGAPHTFMMAVNSNMATFGAKYLYIYDTYITGYSGNTTVAAATCGINITNNSFVLRAVIGV